MRKCEGLSSPRRNRTMPQHSSIFRFVPVATLFAGLALGASATAAPTKKKTASAKSPTRPNVILITIDTLRADHVACYGSRAVKTPTLDGLANDGVVFERAISQVPLTWPSHAVILTGTYPFQNGVQDFTGHPLGAAVPFCSPGLQTAWLCHRRRGQCLRSRPQFRTGPRFRFL